jgi:hypothetical protein
VSDDGTACQKDFPSVEVFQLQAFGLGIFDQSVLALVFLLSLIEPIPLPFGNRSLEARDFWSTHPVSDFGC